jgi:hypothetical protein
MPQGLVKSTIQGLRINLIDNEPEFEVEAVFKSRQLRGKNGNTLSSGRGTIQ